MTRITRNSRPAPALGSGNSYYDLSIDRAMFAHKQSLFGAVVHMSSDTLKVFPTKREMKEWSDNDSHFILTCYHDDKITTLLRHTRLDIDNQEGFLGLCIVDHGLNMQTRFYTMFIYKGECYVVEQNGENYRGKAITIHTGTTKAVPKSVLEQLDRLEQQNAELMKQLKAVAER